MITYSSTKQGFLEDSLSGALIPKLEQQVHAYLGHRVSPSEKASWQSSLQYMNIILSTDSIPADAGVGIEYGLPLGAKRIDFLLTGVDETGRGGLVIVELKQWTEVEAIPGAEGTVLTVLGGGKRMTAHPSYQARSYATTLRDYNEAAGSEDLEIASCAYLHNYQPCTPEPLFSPQYQRCLEESPAFLAPDAIRLREFISRYVRKGDSGRLLYEIENGKIRPSKSLQDALASMLEGNQEFTLLDDQRVVFDTAKGRAAAAQASATKQVVIVEGGPGTGKSVVAINLLVDLIGQGLMTAYISKNSAPRDVYQTKLGGVMKRNRIDSLFRGSGTFTEAESNDYDVLVVDESHRLNEKSGLYGNRGDHQIREIINAAQSTIFFVDDAQRVTLADVGSARLIETMAEEQGAEVTRLKLDSQFRCGGSDGYLEWVESLLQVNGSDEGAPAEFDYDLRLFDNPTEMHDAIRAENMSNNRSRVVAGYCWPWATPSKTSPDSHDIVIPEAGYSASWNLSNTIWAIDAGSVDQVGCIHTCQGLEFDYVGVILGPDIRYENGRIVTDCFAHPGQDKALKGIRSMPADQAQAVSEEIIKNTYYVLMTRGLRGCFVYCADAALADHMRDLLGAGVSPIEPMDLPMAAEAEAPYRSSQHPVTPPC